MCTATAGVTVISDIILSCLHSFFQTGSLQRWWRIFDSVWNCWEIKDGVFDCGASDGYSWTRLGKHPTHTHAHTHTQGMFAPLYYKTHLSLPSTIMFSVSLVQIINAETNIGLHLRILTLISPKMCYSEILAVWIFPNLKLVFCVWWK